MSGVSRSARTETTSATPDGAPSWASRRAPWLLFGVSFLVYAATASRGVVSLDVRTAYIASWRIASSGVPWIEGLVPPRARHPPAPRRLGARGRQRPHRHRPLPRRRRLRPARLLALRLGSVLRNSPGSADRRAAHRGRRRADVPRRAGPPAAAPGAAAAPPSSASPPRSWSVAANGLWPHTLTVLGISGMAWAAARDRWWLVGLFGGVVVWGRLHAARRRRHPRRCSSAVAPPSPASWSRSAVVSAAASCR